MKKTLLLFVALFTATIAFAYDIEIDGIYYNLDHNNKIAEVTDRDQYNIYNYYGDITIPEKITYNATEYSVTSIGHGAFLNCEYLTSIIIPNSVISIGSQAFDDCISLTSITIPNSVISIGSQAFDNCTSLTSITIPNSVTSIGDGAFYGTPWLNNQPDGCVYINNLLYTYKGEMPKNTHIDVNEGTTMICNYAFYKCSSLTSITIPNSDTSIGSIAFSGCSSLTSITIPNSVTSIGARAFENCSSLSSVHISDMAAWCNIDFKDYASNPLCYAKNLYLNGEEVTNLVIPEGVTSIRNYAFSGCSSLTSISIPNSVTSIGDEAFRNCDALTSITIGNSVNKIGDGAFDGCKSVTIINWNAKKCEDFSFFNTHTTPYYTIPNHITELTFGDSVEHIPAYLCLDMANLTLINIPNSVQSIGKGAFYGCESLSSINIPNSVTSIEYETFAYCKKLRTIKLGNSVESIGKDAFKGCTALYSFEISTEIPPIIDATTFAEVSSTLQIKVPCNAVEDYKASNHWNSFLNFKANPYSLTVKTNNNTMGEAFIIKQPNCQDITAQVQAQALPGYEFVKWSDGFTENPHTIYVTRDTTITAEFRKINEEPENKHNIFIVESADKTQGDVTITITAKAIKGFDFSHWSDGSTENPRIVTLDENIELYAYFKVADATNVETSKISSANIYTTNGTLHVENATENYYILDAAGRLIYSGNATTLQLPRGIYLVTINGEVEKIVL